MQIIQKFRIPLFFVLAVFSYGGVVNLGLTGVTFAIPFLIGLIYCSHLIKGGFRMATVLLFLLVLFPLYGLKKSNSSVFFPANGRQIELVKPACVYFIKEKGHPASLTPAYSNPSCPDDSISFVSRVERLNPGMKTIIKSTSVVTEDFGASLAIEFENPYGVVSYRPEVDETLFRFSDNGQPVTLSSLQRPWFQYPSLLMMWPSLPLWPFLIFDSYTLKS